MRPSILRRAIGVALTALILAAHLPLPAATGASSLECCMPKACCQPDMACTAGAGCANGTDHASAPIDRTLPSLLAGNCGDPIPRIVPVSFDPVTPPAPRAAGAPATIVALSLAPAPTAPARDLTPSVPPPRA